MTDLYRRRVVLLARFAPHKLRRLRRAKRLTGDPISVAAVRLGALVVSAPRCTA